MKKNLFIQSFIILGCTAALCACDGFFDKDNTPTPSPLVNFKEEISPKARWQTSVNAGIGNDYLKMVPSISEQTIYTADKNGVVTATDKANGATRWKVSTKAHLTTGVATDNGLVFVSTHDAKVIALSQRNGKILWQTLVPSEVFAPPAAGNGVVLVKTISGQLVALSEQDGHALWHYQQTEPALILHTGSSPQIDGNSVIAGFSNGNLAKLSLKEGSLLWQQTVATPAGSFAIQRMVDIDADPILFNHQIYVATYQGRIAALALSSGKELWTHDISSYTGLAVDNQRVYISDATSHLWAFDAASGRVDWVQSQLEARNITGPAIIGRFIVVGDAEGYLHWLSKEDGHFVARTRLGGNGVLAAPLVDNNIVYLLTKDGNLAAYTL